MGLEGDPNKHFQRFLPYPKHIPHEEKQEWEQYEQEKKRPKVICHDWLFHKWLEERDSKP